MMRILCTILGVTEVGTSQSPRKQLFQDRSGGLSCRVPRLSVTWTLVGKQCYAVDPQHAAVRTVKSTLKPECEDMGGLTEEWENWSEVVSAALWNPCGKSVMAPGALQLQALEGSLGKH